MQNLRIGIEIAELPQQMRGFGHVKAAQVASALEREARLMQEFTSPPELVTIFDPRPRSNKAREHVAA